MENKKTENQVSSELEEFEKLIFYLSKRNSSIFIHNSDKDHAKCLILKMVEDAKKEIKLYTSGNDIIFYEDSNITRHLQNKKLEITILFDDDGNKDKFNKIFSGARFYRLKRNIRSLQLSFSDTIKIDKEYKTIKHFMVVDKEMFRIEVPHDLEPKIVNALGCFNNSEISETLDNSFESIKTQYFQSC